MSRNRWAQSKGGLTWILAAYAIVLLALLDYLPLWTDEILTLRVSRQPDVVSFLDAIRITQGGTLLAFLPSKLTMDLFGAGPFGGRLVSALASIAAMPAVFWLGRKIGLRWPLIPVVLLAVCPLQFRYAMEARPYILALCLSLWATVVFWKLLEAAGPRFRRSALLYAVLVLAIAHTMIYALFVPAAHVLWIAWRRGGAEGSERAYLRRVTFTAAFAVVLAAISIIPWYLQFADMWAFGGEFQGNQNPLTPALPLMVLREFTGMGYFGTAVILIGAGVAIRRRLLMGSHPRLWLLWMLIPILAIPVADFAFGYFFATRQVLMLLAPALLVYALGAERLGKAGLLLSIVFVAGSIYKTAEFLNEPRQDWVAGAEAVERELSVDQGGCIVFVPEGAWAFFGFSHPDLPDRACPDPNAAKHLILAVSPYPDEAPYQAAAAALRQSGKQQISTESFEGPRVEVWE